jgi:hypothetical protein
MTPALRLALGTRCPRCGILGPNHANPLACIDALRDRIAVLGFRHDSGRTTAAKACRGGRRPRADNRWVVLDGESMILSDAARRLGISLVALHFRLVNRTGGKEYDGVDVRAVGADRSKRSA